MLLGGIWASVDNLFILVDVRMFPIRCMVQQKLLSKLMFLFSGIVFVDCS